MITQDKNGTEEEIFAEVLRTGEVTVVSFQTAGPSRELLEQVAIAAGLLVYDAEGNLQDAPNCVSDWIGRYVVTPAVFSEDGETLITPAVLSDEFLVNWRAGPIEKLDRDEDGFELWRLTALAWARQGVTVQITDTLRAYELHGVRQLDVPNIKNPKRVWA